MWTLLETMTTEVIAFKIRFIQNCFRLFSKYTVTIILASDTVRPEDLVGIGEGARKVYFEKTFQMILKGPFPYSHFHWKPIVWSEGRRVRKTKIKSETIYTLYKIAISYVKKLKFYLELSILDDKLCFRLNYK